MRNARVLLLVSGLFSIGFAQTINIAGIVKEGTGTGIANATVMLKKAALSTTTGGDGSFVLSDATVGRIDRNRTVAQPVGHRRFEFNRNILHVTCPEHSLISIRIINAKGRQIALSSHTLGEGNHALAMPHLNYALHVFKIILNNEQHVYKAVNGHFTEQNAAFSPKLEGVRWAASAEVITDTVVVGKTGFVSQNIPISNYIVDLGTITLVKSDGPVVAIDIEGNEYPTVRIGNQVWTTVNFRCKKLNDGTPIPHVTNGPQWQSLTTPGYCYYNNSTDTAFQNKYGPLYNFNTVMTGKLAPVGWRVANQNDWTELGEYLIANGYNWDGTKAGNKVGKSLASSGGEWRTESSMGSVGNDQGSNNSTGFSALPGGCRGSDMQFYYQGSGGYWWSVVEGDMSTGWVHSLESASEKLNPGDHPTNDGCSVRLVQN